MRTYKEFLKEACYVGGEWVGSQNGETAEVRDPASGERLGTVPYAGTLETKQAIDAAYEALNA